MCCVSAAQIASVIQDKVKQQVTVSAREATVSEHEPWGTIRVISKSTGPDSSVTVSDSWSSGEISEVEAKALGLILEDNGEWRIPVNRSAKRKLGFRLDPDPATGAPTGDYQMVVVNGVDGCIIANNELTCDAQTIRRAGVRIMASKNAPSPPCPIAVVGNLCGGKGVIPGIYEGMLTPEPGDISFLRGRDALIGPIHYAANVAGAYRVYCRNSIFSSSNNTVDRTNPERYADLFGGCVSDAVKLAELEFQGLRAGLNVPCTDGRSNLPSHWVSQRGVLLSISARLDHFMPVGGASLTITLNGQPVITDLPLAPFRPKPVPILNPGQPRVPEPIPLATATPSAVGTGMVLYGEESPPETPQSRVFGNFSQGVLGMTYHLFGQPNRYFKPGDLLEVHVSGGGNLAGNYNGTIELFALLEGGW